MLSLRSLLSIIVIIVFTIPAYAAGSDEEDTAETAKPDLTAAKEFIEAKRFKEAIPHLKRARAADDDNADIHNWLGYSYRKIGKFEKSMKNYNRALELNSEHKGALEYKGELYLQIGKLTEAKKLQAKLRQICPESCEELEDLNDAITAFETVGEYSY